MKKLLFFWSELKSTFWFIPVLIILIAIFLALGGLYMDSRMNFSHEGLGRYIYIGSLDSARSILTTISGAMIGVAGTVFSITLVALTLASSQFGSRLIRNFMFDRINQVVLGSYVSTYFYCLIILNASMGNKHDATFIPSFSILMAIIIALANIILLIVFIHHIASRLQADQVISDISEMLSQTIQSIYPENMGEEPGDQKEPDIDRVESAYTSRVVIKARENGYLRYIDGETLMKSIIDLGGFLKLSCKPGDYLVEGAQTGMLYVNEKPDDHQTKHLQSQLIVGRTRSSQQDVEHSIFEMVEIAARALSPGINDPFSAIACIDNLATTLSRLAEMNLPSKYRYDREGNLRILARTLTFEEMLDAAFNQIRQFSSGSLPS